MNQAPDQPRRRPVIGIMGAGEGAGEAEIQQAESLGKLVAEAGWVVLTGGRPVGVMEAANRGAKQISGSLTVGILPNREADVSQWVDVAIFTDLGNGRNNLNTLSSEVVVACGVGGPGTVSEIALALKNRRPVVILTPDSLSRSFFAQLAGDGIHIAESPAAVIQIIHEILARNG